MAGEQIDLHARFLQRPQHTGVVRTVRASSGEDQGRAPFR